MAAEPLPIAEFMERRRREIEIGRADVVRRCGYRKLSKGIRIAALYAGEFENAALATMIRCLPKVLEVGGLAGHRRCMAARGAGCTGARPALAGLRVIATEITGTVSARRRRACDSGRCAT
jgi:hypothetical protein